MLLSWLFILSISCAKEVALDSFANFKYGELNNSAIGVLAENLGPGRLQNALRWLSDRCELFTFTDDDGLILQGYFIPGNLTLNSASCEFESTSSLTTLRPIVFASGWTETTIKSAPALFDLHSMGHDIFAFDLRGQGFSDGPLYHNRTGRKISHVNSFDQFVHDLELFLSSVLPMKFHNYTNNCYSDESRYKLVPSYVGFSLSGLIGKSFMPIVYAAIS